LNSGSGFGASLSETSLGLREERKSFLGGVCGLDFEGGVAVTAVPAFVPRFAITVRTGVTSGFATLTCASTAARFFSLALVISDIHEGLAGVACFGFGDSAFNALSSQEDLVGLQRRVS
jgi:hypothetical protein